MSSTLTTPNRRTNIPLTTWKVTIPTHLATAVETHIFDHARGKPAYGRRSQLISELLELWLKNEEGPTP